MNITDQLRQNTRVFGNAIQAFPENSFSMKPAPDSWSAAEVVEHVYRSEFGLPRLFKGPAEMPSNRDSDKMIQKMRSKLKDTSKKVKAGGPVLPSGKTFTREALLNKFKQGRANIIEQFDTKDPDELCLAFEHPVFGYLTRKEWVYFSIHHAERHLNQIQQIKEQVVSN